jgi:hypothetical protein
MTPRQLADRLQLAAGGALRAELEKRLRGSALRMEAAGKQNAKTRMRVRTGHLRNSIGGFVQAEGAPVGGIGPVQSGADILVGVRAGGVVLQGAEVVYASIQERGGTVRPRRVRWLAIPTARVMTAGPEGPTTARYASPRDYPKPLRFVPLRPGLAALVEAPQGRRRRPVRPQRPRRPTRRERRPRDPSTRRELAVLWWLVKQTTIKPKWFLRDAFQGEAARVPARLETVLRSAMEGAP